jgi:hypothetical protein
MISIDLKNAFSELDINDKKDKISDELIFIGELVKKLQSIYGIENAFEIKNYDSRKQLSEEQTLEILYEDIFEIEKQLLLLVTSIQNNE